MKKTFLYMIAAALTAVSCNEIRIDGPIGYGELVLALTGDPAVDVITKAELTPDQAAGYNVWVCDESGNLFGDKVKFSSSITVPAGTYRVWAESCTEEEAENGQGCVRYLGNSGETAVNVTAGGSTGVTVECSVANALVEVIFDPSIKDKFTGNLSVTFNRTKPERELTVSGTYVQGTEEGTEEGIEVWFNAGSTVTYQVSGTLKDGSAVSGEGSLNDIVAKSYTKIIIKLTSEGQLTLTPEVNTDIKLGNINSEFNPYL